MNDRSKTMIVEKGVVAGNVFDKYATQNPIYRRLMGRFLDTVEGFVRQTGFHDIYEAGCGEGYLAATLASRIPGLSIRGSDFSEQVIAEAAHTAAQSGLPLTFTVKDIYTLGEQERADLVLCCEVLEHLEKPEAALERVVSIAKKAVILSVPHEPIWRVLNFCRGKYMSDWGNTPGHLNHWTQSGFRRMVEQFAHVEEVKSPLPWTVLLCRPKGR